MNMETEEVEKVSETAHCSQPTITQNYIVYDGTDIDEGFYISDKNGKIIKNMNDKYLFNRQVSFPYILGGRDLLLCRKQPVYIRCYEI